MSANLASTISLKTSLASTPAGRTAWKTAQDFESVFLSNMLENVFAGIKTDGPFGGGKSEEVYRSMLAGEYAQQFARAGGVGIAEQVAREIIAMQETASQ